MGYDVYDDELFGKPIRVFSIKTDDLVLRALKRQHTSQLKYDTSWDWLMAVVQKIKATNREAFIIDFVSGPLSPLAILYIDSSLESVYGAVVQFIKLYNSQRKPISVC